MSTAKAKRSRKSESTPQPQEASLAHDEVSDEAHLWTALNPTATAAVSFWNAFLGLRAGTDPLTADQLQRWVDLTRAVSWVESKHGTYDGDGGQNGKVDPMQCADTRNPWWPELTTNASSTDRFVRGPGLSNLNSNQLPAAAATAPGFDTNAAISKLATASAGSADPNFTQTHSIYWGVPLLIFKTNHTYGTDPCYQCRDLSFDRLTQGAGKFNGSSASTAYVSAIKNALALFGGLSQAASLMQPTAIYALSGPETPAGHAPKPPVITTHPSPNYTSRQGNTIQYLILHNTDAPLGSSLNTLTTAGGPHPVSAHYLVDRSKDIYQLVSDSDVAWHAGNKIVNQQSIGIEVVAWKDALRMTADQEASLIALVRFILDAYDIPLKNVLPHRRVRIGGTDCPGLIWPTDPEFDKWVQTHIG
jgi:hypothetical protein